MLKLLLTVFEQDMTGILYFKNDEVLKVLYISRGKLTWAISNSDEDKLENILVDRNIVASDTLNKVKREAPVSDSVGKLLVEKGLITLEELIENSRLQLRRIIISILKWKHGSFQFIKDAPPERLLSLDLNITDFIIGYILEEVDIGDIWKEIGSLQVEFMKNPDPDKVNRYNLSEQQTQLLNNFTGENKLETILSRHSGGHRESLLKIVYFFLMAELLIKKEFDLSDSSVFEDDDEFDPFKGETALKPDAGFGPVRTEPESGPAKEGAYVMGANEVGKDAPPEEAAELRKARELLKPVKAAKPLDSKPPPTADKKKFKMLNLVMVTLILVLGGVILLILPMMFEDTPVDRMMKTNKDGDIITLEPAEIGLKKEDVPADGADAGAPAQDDVETVEDKPPVTDPKKDPEKKTPPPQDKPGDKPGDKPVTQKTVDKPTLVPGKSAMSYFNDGKLIIAGDIWRRDLRKAGYRYSILLELDCMKESVLNAYSRVLNKAEFFILNKKSGRKNCFLVMYGKYRTRSEATKGIDKVPQYFWKQSNPPQVVELNRYL